MDLIDHPSVEGLDLPPQIRRVLINLLPETHQGWQARRIHQAPEVNSELCGGGGLGDALC
jgi:hypothetical protein